MEIWPLGFGLPTSRALTEKSDICASKISTELPPCSSHFSNLQKSVNSGHVLFGLILHHHSPSRQGCAFCLLLCEPHLRPLPCCPSHLTVASTIPERLCSPRPFRTGPNWPSWSLSLLPIPSYPWLPSHNGPVTWHLCSCHPSRGQKYTHWSERSLHRSFPKLCPSFDICTFVGYAWNRTKIV